LNALVKAMSKRDNFIFIKLTVVINESASWSQYLQQKIKSKHEEWLKRI
jgi:hypothetical protein